MRATRLIFMLFASVLLLMVGLIWLMAGMIDTGSMALPTPSARPSLSAWSSMATPTAIHISPTGTTVPVAPTKQSLQFILKEFTR